MSNPFETNTEGPRYGNAYENTPISSPPPTLGGNVGSPALPPRNKPQQGTTTNSPYGTQRMPSPSDYHQAPHVNNAWQESNKTLDENRSTYSPSPQPQNAYQYTGTQYGNTSTTENAYSPQPVHNTTTTVEQSHKIETPMNVSDNDATYNTTNKAGLPSKLRLLIRFILFVAGVGHLGFAAGASPYSGEKVPFSDTACFYFLFAVAIFSIIYSGFHIIFYFVRRFGKKEKMKRTILILCDLLMALLWGIGIIVEIAKFKCPPGYYNGWCNFYNTSIFFGFISFVLYIVTLGWDVVGICKNRKK